MANKHKICLKCSKPLHKAPQRGVAAKCVKTDPEILLRVHSFRRQSHNPIKEGEYQHQIHLFCYEELQNFEADAFLEPQKDQQFAHHQYLNVMDIDLRSAKHQENAENFSPDPFFPIFFLVETLRGTP